MVLKPYCTTERVGGATITTIALLGTPLTANRLLGQHWTLRKKNADLWKGMVKTLLRNNIPLKPYAKFTLHAHSYRSRLLDYDGLVSCLKAPIDGMKGLLIEDDGWGNSGPWIVTQSKCKRGEEHLVLKIIASQG